MQYFYVGIKDGHYYYGYTADLKNRFVKHNSSRHNFELIYYEAYKTEKMARDRERDIKQFGGAWRALRKRLKIITGRAGW